LATKLTRLLIAAGCSSVKSRQVKPRGGDKVPLPLPDNVQSFNLATVRLFAILYEAFPVPVNVAPDDLLDLEPWDKTTEFPQERLRAIQFVDGMSTWLEREGFFTKMALTNGGDIIGRRLTPKGMTC